MSIKSDKWIKRLCVEKNMISPFVDRQIKEENGKKLISYGLSSYGYDIRLGNEFKLINPRFSFTDSVHRVLDPKEDLNDCFETVYSEHSFIIPAHGFTLAKSVERFDIPRNVTAVCVGKSTLARLGLVVNVTPLEAMWSGVLTLELSNTTDLAIRVYVNEGIAQLLFHESDEECAVSYADRNGKYQNQEGIALPRL